MNLLLGGLYEIKNKYSTENEISYSWNIMQYHFAVPKDSYKCFDQISKRD